MTGIVGLVLGFGAGFLYRKSVAASNAMSIEARAQQLLLDTQRDADSAAKRTLQDAKDEASAMRREGEEDLRGRRDELARQERRMTEEQEELRLKGARIEARATELEERDEKLTYVRTQLEKATDLHRAQLEKIAGMTSLEARDHLTGQVIAEAKRVAMSQVREIEQRAREEGEERARKIVTIAIQRVASEQTAESTVSVFALPSEDMKGRIIGREGRNIRAFEATTGVNLIIDDTPEA
ncbi:MAG TPA: Rnase Y domain-containing protein, partial [Actinomycetota bacterium]|nr:Rnase Y domain-containing protein [Actinomycetota bacterium]